jgi:hypothetical protein
MRLVKLVFISLFILAALITGIASLFPSTVIVSRAVEVNTTPQKIAYYTANLHHWNLWLSDCKEQSAIFKGDTMCIGTQTIVPIATSDSSVRFHWVATGQAPYLVQLEWIHIKDNTYVIHWSFEQHVKWYPWEKFQTLLNEKVLGSKMEIELANLNTALLSDTQ